MDGSPTAAAALAVPGRRLLTADQAPAAALHPRACRARKTAP